MTGLIESKDQYERGEFIRGCDAGDYYSASYVEALKETIEALREVARSANRIWWREGVTNPTWVEKLDKALARIEQEAPWLLEQEDE